ncbi:hypothetical protein D3C75_951080 [compost metagenome]
MSKTFTDAVFDLENQIMEEKISQGVNGIEWLVLQKVVDEIDLLSLEVWLKTASNFGERDPEPIMLDALTMKADPFYEKHEINWWISIDDILTYLSLLRQRDYNRYSDFIRDLEKKGAM